jgi:hypothetical protein
MLADPRHDHRTIGDIAFASGFRDLAHFSIGHLSSASVKARGHFEENKGCKGDFRGIVRWGLHRHTTGCATRFFAEAASQFLFDGCVALRAFLPPDAFRKLLPIHGHRQNPSTPPC